MIGPLLHFEVDEEDVLVSLYALLTATSGPSLGMYLETVVEEWLESRARQRFESEGDAASGQWEQLLFPETHEFRRSQGFPPAHPINRRTGALMNWVTTAGGTTTVFSAGSGAILSWPDMPSNAETMEKLRTAQTGKGDPYTPRRPVLAIDAIDMSFALDSLEKWIIAAVENPSGTWRL